MKAQASLEMVVGLIILLVVAGVVISLVIYYISPEKMPSPGEKLSKRAFLTDCESYCKDLSSIEYCRYYYPGADWDKDGLSHKIVEVGKYKWPTCEDRVYCFLVYPCEDRFGMGLDTIETCRKVLCDTYLEKYNWDVELAENALEDDIDIKSITVCDFSGYFEENPEDNWHELVFSKGCSDLVPGE